MKFEDYLMEGSEDQQQHTTHDGDLDEEVQVVKLQAELDRAQEVNRVLQCALQGPVSSHPCLLSLLPPQVRMLFMELATVEEEILLLERKVDGLKLKLYHERKQNDNWQIQQRKTSPPITSSRSLLSDDIQPPSRSQNYDEFRKQKLRSNRRASLGSAADFLKMFSRESTEEMQERSRRHATRIQNHFQIINGTGMENPNLISEELIKCLISIFLELNGALPERERSTVVPKLGLPSANSKGLIAKTSLNCKATQFSFYYNASNFDPYGVLPDIHGTIRDIGPYKNFIHITRCSLDVNRFTECSSSIDKLRVLMEKLCSVDLSFLPYKQKLAFWINIYNACIMHAFLEHGLPSTQDKLLDLMNKAAMNVGGIVLNALAIEHFILRHPCESEYGPMEEKETLLRHAYGLGFPEPNITFALCRGTWSSPALHID
ncbi:uncharacterized protein LOC110823922 isoform X2 [Carica papaya]|uniref:uncharacterized protein LOC110823922 isoform X2 n=1 Tax=Carica papaya TaxID=3649 RepID=UPI000B8CE27B|nr:uncharacterized protein LOC110823922 isoform X2 [Carica papaya]